MKIDRVARARSLTVQREKGFVVFIIGARINKWWMFPVLWGVSRAMSRMMEELLADPDSGLLSYEAYSGRTTMMIQYWRSFKDLEAYAHDRQRQHVPAWQRWTKKWGLTQAVGIYHETYVVEPGTYECLYENMPAFGLGRVGPLVPAKGELRTATQRLQFRRPEVT